MTYNKQTENPRGMEHCDKIFTSTNNTFRAMI